jgi:VanZ family protein
LISRKRVYLCLLVLWVAFTFLLTSAPNLDVDVPLPYADKIAHFGFYGVMGFLFAMWRRESGVPVRIAVISGLVFTTLVGAADEVHQYWIPGRTTDVFDWVADTAGGGIGSLFSVYLPSLFPFLLNE